MDSSEFSKFQRRDRYEHGTLRAQWFAFQYVRLVGRLQAI